MTFLLAAVSFEPSAIAAWLVLGLFVGWASTKLTEEASYGALGDLILGGIGGLGGGFSYGLFRADSGFWGAAVVALIVPIVLIGVARAIVAMRSE